MCILLVEWYYCHMRGAATMYTRAWKRSASVTEIINNIVDARIHKKFLQIVLLVS